MAIGCLANWLRNRSFHCAITAPLFLIAGIAFSAGRSARDPLEHRFGLAIRSHRNRHSVSIGMALCETFCDLDCGFGVLEIWCIP
jgi:hypothetical protein